MIFLEYAIQAYMLICVVRIIFSWLPQDNDGGVLGGIQTLAYSLTEPVFGTVRRAMPRVGDLPIDFSPIVVFLGLGLLLQIVRAIGY